jgi:hypothetical protein
MGAFINDAGTAKKLLEHIGEATQPARIAPANGPPPWETAAAAEPAGNDAQWDSSVHPAPEIEFDQRIAWSAGDARAGDAIREAFLQTVMRAGPKPAIDGSSA